MIRHDYFWLLAIVFGHGNNFTLQPFNKLRRCEYPGHGSILENFYDQLAIVADRQPQQDTFFDGYYCLVFMPALVFYQLGGSGSEQNFRGAAGPSLKNAKGAAE